MVGRRGFKLHMAVFGFLKRKESMIELPPAGEADGRHVSYLEMPPLPIQKTTTQPALITLPEFPRMPAKEEDVPSTIPPIEAPKVVMAPRMMEQPKRAPIFVGIQHYNAVLSELDALKAQISTAENALGILVENKAREDSEFERWRANLEELERKLMFIDKALFER